MHTLLPWRPLKKLIMIKENKIGSIILPRYQYLPNLPMYIHECIDMQNVGMYPDMQVIFLSMLAVGHLVNQGIQQCYAYVFLKFEY